jgi:T5SS/PEP-CTERM-associated repeat protein
VVQQFGGTIDIKGNLAVGFGGDGEFYQLGGSLNANIIAVGSTIDDTQQTIGNDGLFEVHPGATLNATALRIGMLMENQGIFRQLGGNVVIDGPIHIARATCCGGSDEDRRLELLGGTLSSQTAVIGRDPFGIGSALVDGGAWTIEQSLIVAERDASAFLDIRGGGSVSADSAVFGGQDSGGSIVVSGQESLLQITNGVTAGTCLGSAVVDISDGGQVNTGPVEFGVPCSSLPGFAHVAIAGKDSQWSTSGTTEFRGAPFGTAPLSDLTLNDGGRFETGEFKIIADPGNNGGASLHGDGGTLAANVINMSRVAPGQNADASFGALQIEGDYIQLGSFISNFPDPNAEVTEAGELQSELGGAVSGTEFDALNVSGAFGGRGSLLVTLENGFDPPQGSVFEVVSFGAFDAPFDETALPTFPDSRIMVVEYVADSGGPGVVRLRVTSTCPADTNGTGNIDVDDLLDVINNWGSCSGCAADTNGSGAVDVDDLLEVINNWGSCLD